MQEPVPRVDGEEQAVTLQRALFNMHSLLKEFIPATKRFSTVVEDYQSAIQQLTDDSMRSAAESKSAKQLLKSIANVLVKEYPKIYRCKLFKAPAQEEVNPDPAR